MKEDKIQSECVVWYNNTYCLEHHNPRGIIFSVPNGGTRNKKEAMTLKATGLLSGVADLIVMLPFGKLIFIEMKTYKGSQTDKQIDFQTRVEMLGFDYHLIRSIDEFKQIIENYLK